MPERRSTLRYQRKAPLGGRIRRRRRPDLFGAVTPELRTWFEAEPWRTSRELLERLQVKHPGVYPDQQLRTLQRRVKAWRRELAQKMVFGMAAQEHAVEDAAMGSN
jgi:hypothetical protein